MFFFDKQEVFEFSSGTVEHGYLAILDNDLESAKSVFEKIDSPRGKWGISLVEILGGFLKRTPTYFEIRNFLEIDMDFLLKNEKFDYIEYLLGSSELLKDYNQEVYKYVARVFYNNGFYNVAREYLEKAKRTYYNDPELHFMLCNYFYKFKDYKEAIYYISECLRILPDYYPALKMQESIKAII